jgi:hypothetical protein
MVEDERGALVRDSAAIKNELVITAVGLKRQLALFCLESVCIDRHYVLSLALKNTLD